jgi:hypothetical protein
LEKISSANPQTLPRVFPFCPFVNLHNRTATRPPLFMQPYKIAKMGILGLDKFRALVYTIRADNETAKIQHH